MTQPEYEDSDPGDCPELNMSNYDHDDVATLNAWAVQARACIDRLTREATPPVKTGKFGHHPDPAMDFSFEVDVIEAEITDRAAGLPATMDLGARIEQAMQFKVGGDAAAVVAKAELRKMEAAFKAGRNAAPDAEGKPA